MTVPPIYRQDDFIPLTDAEVSAIELRNAAIHEAAHAVIARHLGHIATPEIHRTPDPTDSDKIWIGSTTLYSKVGSYDDRLISLAGLIAEEVSTCPDIDADEIFDALDGGAIELSSTDAQGAGSYDALNLVRGLWSKIDSTAQFLAEKSR
jgi:hypothetical protein